MTVLYDVGAHGGIPERWQGVPDLMVVGFEPDPAEYQRLTVAYEPHGWRVLPYALSSRAAELPFYVCRDPRLSSLYCPNEAYLQGLPEAERFDVVATQGVATRTLDEVIACENLPAPDFIKLDTQGSELDILRGSEAALEHAYGVEVEVEYVELYRGQPLFADVDAFLAGRGFRLCSARANKRSRSLAVWGGEIVFANAVYFRGSAPASIRRLYDRKRRKAARRAKRRGAPA